jgi:hypothetical protein
MDGMEDSAVINGRSLIDIPVHPAADLFPMINGDPFVSLINDIKANGQEFPVLVWNGAIVDGRNRYAACKAAGSKPKTKSMEFTSECEAIRFIISTNIHRRHLTESQRAMIASELAKLGRGRPSGDNPPIGGLSQEEAAASMQVSERSVQRAREVQEKAPDLAAKVKSGELKVSKAASMARERARQTQPVTDPDRADDKVVDAKIERASNGYTPKMEKVWAAYSALDAVEQTAFRERMNA